MHTAVNPDPQSVRGAAQVLPHTPPLQRSPAAHACPQPPQCAALLL